MQGNTHAAVGCASVLFIQTQIPTATSFQSICTATLIGLIAANIPDIDTEKSKIHSRIKSILISLGIILIIFIIMERIKKMSFSFSYYMDMFHIEQRQIYGVILLILFLLFGLCQIHRGFTHSLLALFLFTVIAYLISPTYYFYAFVGYITHLITDIVNKKGMQVLYPYKKRYSFYWCTSTGIANKVLFYISVSVSAICLYLQFYNLTHFL